MPAPTRSRTPRPRRAPRLPRALLAALVALAAAPDEDAVRPGPWSARDVPEGWVVTETDAYQVQSEVGEDKARRLAEHLEGLLPAYRELLPDRRRLPTLVLKVFRDREAYRAYGGVSVAHYDDVHGEIACYDTGVVLGRRDVPAQIRLADPGALDLRGEEHDALRRLLDDVTDALVVDVAEAVAHEGWHQVLHETTVSQVAMPAWIDEGVADWFSTARLDPETGRWTVGALHHGRLRVVRRALEEGRTVSFGEMLGFDQDDYYRDAETSYAQGWSMVAFLMRHEDPALREAVGDLIAHFRRSKDFRESTERVFRDRDLDALGRDWEAWVAATEPDDPFATLAEAFGDRLRPEHLEAPPEWLAAYERARGAR